MKAGWKTRQLHEICQFENGDRGENYPSKSVQTTTGVPFINAGHLTESGIDFSSMNYIPRERFNLLGNGKIRRGDILFCLRGSLGKFASVGELNEGSIASSLVILRPLEKLSDRFLLAYLQSDVCTEMIDQYRNGAAQPNLSAGNLKKFLIPVPPLPEQHRILAILDEAFEGIATAKANAEKNLQNARALFESHLQSVFSERGEGWVTRRLGDLVTRLTNGYVGPTRNIYHESGVPYLLARHVKNNRLAFDGKTFISEEFNRKNKKSILLAGDVLLVQSGHIGHAAVVTQEHQGHNCHAMIVMTPVKEVLVGPFLSLFFLSSGMKQTFEKIRSGSTVPHLTCGAVKELEIPLLNVPTQLRLVEELEEIQAETERLESIYQRKLAALDDLKQSLLHQAFSGQL